MKKKVSFWKTFIELNKPVEEDEFDIEERKKRNENDKIEIAIFIMGACVANAVSYWISGNWIVGLFAGLVGGYLAVTFSNLKKKRVVK